MDTVVYLADVAQHIILPFGWGDVLRLMLACCFFGLGGVMLYAFGYQCAHDRKVSWALWLLTMVIVVTCFALGGALQRA